MNRLLERVHRALIFGDYALAGKLLADHGVQLTDKELAAWIRMGGVWMEVA